MSKPDFLFVIPYECSASFDVSAILHSTISGVVFVSLQKKKHP
ncbi:MULTISPECIES: hypothetical protein [Paenibacillus]|nr:hypothetical protein [Paenibacillus odorifer]